MPKNKLITRDDIISKEALSWGDDYAKSIKKAIKLNKKFKKSIQKLKKCLGKL